MKIKTVPEDFLVEEIATHELSEGLHTLVSMTKRDMTTERAIQEIQKQLRVPRKSIGYAGQKDKRAVTIQNVSIRASSERIEQFHHEKISLEHLGSIAEPLGLGMLDGNKFTITVRGLKNEKLQQLDRIPNYFDTQRFSTGNAVVGLRILKKEYEAACHHIIDTDKEYGLKMKQFLEKRENDYIGALRLLPNHTLLLYVHAYQSLLFNKLLTKYIGEHEHVEISGPVPIFLPKTKLEDTLIPLIGFDSQPKEPFATWMHELLEHDGLVQRDFVNRQIPFLTMEGAERAAFVPIGEFHASDREQDELGEEEKQILSFTLPSGSYATIVVKCLYRTGEL